jgi:hypothetical protein
MNTQKQSDETTMALMGKDISTIKENISSINRKIEAFGNNRYVTQDEMHMAIKESRDGVLKELVTVTGDIKDDMAGIKKLLWFIGTTFAGAVILAFAKLVLKV